jgi:DNA polymerase-3 subunit alpha (Gram-positive type)
MLEDLTGIDAQKIKLDDEKTLSLFSGTEALGVTPEQIGAKTGTLGIPEFGTKFVRQMLEDTKPSTFSHLVRISGLSHGTNVWVGNAQDLVLNGTADISQIIACRDDIMIYLIQKGMDSSHAFQIMEQVRKGKGLKPEDITAMREQEVPDWYIESCQKISYMFPKAHAVAYVTMAFRIAWFKVYYPEAFYATFFTVRADEFDAELIAAGVEKCRAAIEEIMRKGNNCTAKEKNLLTILELAVEMYCRRINLLKVDLWKSSATCFLITPEGILPPFSALQGVGKTAAASLGI